MEVNFQVERLPRLTLLSFSGVSSETKISLVKEIK